MKMHWLGIMKLKANPLLKEDQPEMLNASAKLLWTELGPPQIFMLTL